MAKIANVALTNTFNTWRTNSNIAFDRLSQFAIDSRTLYANTIIANNVLRASGNTVLGGALKRTIVNGLFSANGQVTIGTNLTVSGNTTLGAAGKTITSTGLLGHTGRATVSTNLTVSGNTSTNKATVTSLLTVSGNTTFANLVTISGRATVGTNLTVSGNTLINTSGANGVYSNTASFGVFSNNVNFSSKKIRNFTEDAMSYRASSTAITLSTQRNVQRVSLTGNATVTLPTGMPGRTEAIKTIVVIFKQDATGSRTMAFAAPAGETLLFNNSATLPAVSSAANKVTIYVCTKFDGDTRWYISQSFVEA